MPEAIGIVTMANVSMMDYAERCLLARITRPFYIAFAFWNK